MNRAANGAKITIILAEGATLLRCGLRALLEAEKDCRVVGEARDGYEAVQLVARLQAAVLVADLQLSVLNGLEVIRRVARVSPQTRIIAISENGNEMSVVRALRYGAAGYVVHDAVPTDLVRAIREVLGGRRYLSSPFSSNAIELYMRKARVDATDPYEKLTEREREVLQLVCEGHSNGEIARHLGISPRTVEVHRGHMMHKLNLRNQVGLARYAIARGILPVESFSMAP